VKPDAFLASSAYFGLVLSIAGYWFGLWCRRKLRLAVVNPLLIAVVLVIAVLALFRVDEAVYRESARLLSSLLTPATVCLAIPLYAQRALLKKNLRAIAVGVAAGVLSGLAGVYLLSLLFRFTHEQYVTLLPKSVTTAIGMGISQELGGVDSVTTAAIIMTGVLGNIIAENFCKLLRIKEPVARGVAIGTSAHAIGTAKAMELGEVEGAMSSLAIMVAGFLTAAAAAFFAGLL
jgi:predicted murein hydrolase (TIGR00659 family)